jgi:hypothetical protein
MDRFAANPASLVGLMAGLSLTLVWTLGAVAKALGRRDRPAALGAYGAAAFAGSWCVLLPLERSGVLADPGLSGALGAIVRLQWFACAVLCAVAARDRRGPARWTFAAGGLLIVGELSAWGQALAGLRSPDDGAVETVSLIQLAPPTIPGAVPAAVGWALIVAALALRYLPRPGRPVLDAASAWITRSRLGLPLALTTGTLLMHPALHAIAGFAASAAALHGMAFVWLRTGPAAGRPRGPYRPFLRHAEASGR